MKKRVEHLIRKVFRSQSKGYHKSLHAIEESVRVKKRSLADGIKIVIGPSLSQYEPCFVHDKLLSTALRLRGAEVIPIYCDKIQEVECNVNGGIWVNNSFERACERCCQASKKMWPESTYKPVRLSMFMLGSDKQEISKITSHLDENSWYTYSMEGFTYGKWARDILVNNYLVGDHELVENSTQLGIVHVGNLILLKNVYKRLLKSVKPGVVISNDSYYGMWAVLQELCKKRSIPFYSTWLGGRQNAWCYAFNDAAMNLDFRKPWKKFSSQELSSRQKKKVESWLNKRVDGGELILDTASVDKTKQLMVSKVLKYRDRPTALIAANIVWDLAALNKQLIFADMVEWVKLTIEWFAKHPEYQLIVKSHPGEKNTQIPQTIETVEKSLMLRKTKIPENVVFLSADSQVSVYDLFKYVDVGIVHTSTVGIELVASGIPVITTASSPYRDFGFTKDPINSEEYYTTLEKTLLTSNASIDKRGIELARKFILFYQFHYYTKIDLFDYKWHQTPKLKIKSGSELMKGENLYLDYIVESILSYKPIVSENRWPPES